jgi:hypothetical protein
LIRPYACVQRSRALIFVSHSIGSIVVKEVSGFRTADLRRSFPTRQALCHLSPELIAISQACRGVLFIGAPHRETGKASFGQIAAKAAAALHPSLPDKVIRDLEENSDAFDRVNDAFIKYVEGREATFTAITFYEEVEAAAPNLGEVGYLDLNASSTRRLTKFFGDHC